jgi:predicted alpha/beta-fold hydrolase
MSSVMVPQQLKSNDLKAIVQSFRASTFVPQRGWLGLGSNCHYQTIVGSEALRTKLVGSYPRGFSTTRERLHTPDGDFFDIDYTTNLPRSEHATSTATRSAIDPRIASNEDIKGIVIMLHGLESNTQGPLTTKMATSFLSKGFACALVSFRSCSGEDNLTPGAYHLGFYKDLDQTARLLHARYPTMSLYLSG